LVEDLHSNWFKFTEADQSRTNITNHLEADRDLLQHLRHIFAQLAECSAALDAARFLRQMGVRLARQMGRQLPASGGCRNLCNRISYRDRRDMGFGDRQGFGSGFKFLKLEFELFYLTLDLLRTATELHPAQLGDQQLKNKLQQDRSKKRKNDTLEYRVRKLFYAIAVIAAVSRLF
jgi:hypothetical protein